MVRPLEPASELLQGLTAGPTHESEGLYFLSVSSPAAVEVPASPSGEHLQLVRA